MRHEKEIPPCVRDEKQRLHRRFGFDSHRRSVSPIAKSDRLATKRTDSDISLVSAPIVINQAMREGNTGLFQQAVWSAFVFAEQLERIHNLDWEVGRPRFK